MNSKMIVKLALSGAVIAIPTAGCSTLNVGGAKGISSTDVLAKRAESNARKAEKQLAKGKLDKAQRFAELAVEGDLTNPSYRSTLAKVYMAQGRFQSAEQTLNDVVQLGINDPRTVVSLALTRIAQGRTQSAIALIEANRSLISDSDYGLALALGGQDAQAVDVLTQAIRADGATARTRQNLALAYALNGRWREARIMASQDLDAEAVNKQISEWAHYARPGAYERRIAGLLGVTPQADSGQPVRLALANANKPALASAAPAQAPKASQEPVKVASSPVDLLPRQDQELKATGPAPVNLLPRQDQKAAVAPAAAPIATNVEFAAAAENNTQVAAVKPAMEAPLIAAVKGPLKKAVAAAPVAKAPVKLAIANTKPKLQKQMSGSHVVQLGAFSSTDSAKRAWTEYNRQYSVLGGFASASSSVTVGGKRLVRLAAMGFGNKESADSVCERIKSRGGSCIVRSVGSKKPVRLALR